MFKNKGRYLILVALAVSFTGFYCWQTGVHAEVEAVCGTAGFLDGAFGTSGKVVTSLSSGDDHARAVRVQADGKIVVAGDRFNSTTQKFDYAVVRYNTDGTLDTTFDADGIATASVGTLDDVVNGVVIQADGKIVVAGASLSGSNYDFSLIRFNADGSLDTTFGTGGKVTTAVGAADDIGTSIALTSGGKIVVAGYTALDQTAFPLLGFAVVRYNADGTLDTTFDTDGKQTTSFAAGTSASAFGVAVQGDGKTVAAGVVTTGAANTFALARYNTDGSLDTSFDTDGKVTTAVGPIDDAAYSVAIQSDNKIVAAGYTGTPAGIYSFALTRYNTNGSLDTSFDTDGIVTTSFLGADDTGESVALQADGKIVAGGYARNGANLDFALARYNTNGSLDTSFGTGGKTTTAATTNDPSRAVAIQPDGNIVMVGSTVGTGLDFTVLRYAATTCPAFEGDINSSPVGTGDGDVTIADVIIYGRVIRGEICPGATSPPFQQKLDAGPRTTLGDGLLGSSDGSAIDAYSRHDATSDFNPATPAWDPTPAGGPTTITNLGCTPRPEMELFSTNSARDVNGITRAVRLVPVRSGSTLTVYVEMDAAGNEGGTQFSLKWNPAAMTISGISGVNSNPDVTLGADAPAGTTLNVNAERAYDGNIALVANLTGSGANNSGAKKGKRIAVMTFRLFDPKRLLDLDLAFTDDVVHRQTVDNEGSLIELPGGYVIAPETVMTVKPTRPTLPKAPKFLTPEKDQQ